MRFKALSVVGIFFASTSIALAGNIPAAWIGWKAEKIVVRDATVRLPAQERKSLETELRMTVANYRLLEETAAQQHGENEQPAGKLHNLRYRFSTALKRVQQGLAIDKAACVGNRGLERRQPVPALSLCGQVGGARDPVGGGHLGRRPDHRGGRGRAAHAGPLRGDARRPRHGPADDRGSSGRVDRALRSVAAVTFAASCRRTTPTAAAPTLET